MAEPLDENTFTSAIEGATIDAAPLIEGIVALRELEKEKQANTFTDKLIEALAEKGQHTDAIPLIDRLVELNASNRTFKRVCRDKLEKLFADDEEQLTFVKASGFDNVRLRVTECYRRFKTLRALKPKVGVYHKTAGFGVVKKVSHTDGKAYIDFREKPNHGMAFSYASESLDVVPDEHIFAQHHKNPDKIEEMIKDKPEEIIRMALRSFGPKPIAILQEKISPSLVPESRWKRFWDKARKELKLDPLVVIPAKRTSNIELLEKAVSYDDDWFKTVSVSRDMEEILALLDEYRSQDDPQPLTESQREIAVNRLAFVMKGSQARSGGLAVKTLLTAKKLGITDEEIGATDFVNRLFAEDSFLEVVKQVPAKERKAFFAHLEEEKPEETMALLESVLLKLDYSALNDVANILMEKGREDVVRDALRGGWNTWKSNVFHLYWLSKNPDKVEEWQFGDKHDLAMRILADIEQEYSGEENRVQNQLRDLFRNHDWLKEVFESIDERKRRTITTGVRNSTAWPSLEQNSVLGKIVKLHPTMQQIVSGRGESEGTVRKARVTSYRSYKDRAAQLEKITKEDIPQNSRDIAKAREYGDLRENFEYKSAKDAQRLLMERQAQLEKDLETYSPTDFSDWKSDTVDLATGVKLKFEDGKSEQYWILGAWDSDEGMRIISNQSRLARALMGSAAGDEVSVPSEQGEVLCTVEEVLPLTDEIREWIGEADVEQVEEDAPIEEGETTAVSISVPDPGDEASADQEAPVE